MSNPKAPLPTHKGSSVSKNIVHEVASLLLSEKEHLWSVPPDASRTPKSRQLMSLHLPK